MSTMVTIPTANYTHDLVFRNQHLDQQCKLWRFLCTAIDLNCPNYKVWDYRNKNLSSREKYLDWVKRWKKSYSQLSDLIREQKKSRKIDWFRANSSYQLKIRQYNALPETMNEYDLYLWNVNRLDSSILKLKESAQHLLNARYINKLAGYARSQQERMLLQEKTIYSIAAE